MVDMLEFGDLGAAPTDGYGFGVLGIDYVDGVVGEYILRGAPCRVHAHHVSGRYAVTRCGRSDSRW